MLHLGKSPFVADARDVRLTAILEVPLSALPVPPPSFGFGMAYADWLMLGNGPDDSVESGFQGAGDCVWAGAAHEHMLWNRAAGHPVVFDGKAVVSDYSAATGYVLDDPSTDNGTDVRAALLYRRDIGISDSSGVRHTIGAFIALTPGDVAELEQAAYLFEAVAVGVQFPDSAMAQFDAGQPWDIVPGANIEGGHYVVATGRRSLGDLGVLSWGKRQSMHPDWYREYADEAWAVVTEEELRNGVNRRGLSLAKLQQALQQIHA